MGIGTPNVAATGKAGFADTLGRDPMYAAGLLWLNPPDPERLDRWGLDLSAFLPKPLTPEEMVRHTNAFRSAHGLPPLTINPALNAAAQARAVDMKTHRYFAHQNLDTSEGPGRGDRGGRVRG
jgi:hypothetical protein